MFYEMCHSVYLFIDSRFLNNLHTLYALHSDLLNVTGIMGMTSVLKLEL
jgi:hypothetical protein